MIYFVMISFRFDFTHLLPLCILIFDVCVSNNLFKGCARVLRAGGSVTDAGLDEQLPELDAEYARTLLARCAPLCDIHNPIELDNCVAPGSARRFGVASAGEARDQSDLPRACSLKPGADAFGRTGVDVLLVERIDELQEAPAESVAASAVDADDDLRRDVPSASELAHEPLPLRAFEWPGTAIASAAMVRAFVLLCFSAFVFLCFLCFSAFVFLYFSTSLFLCFCATVLASASQFTVCLR